MPAKSRAEDNDRPRRSRDQGKQRRRGESSAGKPLIWIIAAAGGSVFLIVLLLSLWAAGVFSRDPAPQVAGPGVAGGPAPVVNAPAAQPAPVEAPPPFPPTPWIVAPGGGPAIEPLPDYLTHSNHYMRWQVLPRSREYLAVRHDKGRDRLYRGRMDERGHAAEFGELVLSSPGDTGLWGEMSRPIMADVSPDGRLAIYTRRDDFRTDPVLTTGVRVWAAKSGGATVNQSPIPCHREGWLGWNAAGNLLVLSENKMTLWDASTGPKKLNDLPGTRPGAAALPPSRAWVIVSSEGKYLEVLDSATGDVLGRLEGEGTWFWLTVSPDGTRLAGLKALPSFGLGGPMVMQMWDLTTGKTLGSMQLNRSNSDRLLWAGRDHLVHLRNDPPMAEAHLIDPAARSLIGRLVFPHDRNRDNGPQPLSASADGRLWWAYAGALFTVPLEPPPDNQAAFKPGSTVAVVASTGNAERDRRIVSVLTARLEKEGFRSGPGAWVYQVTAEVADGGGVLKVGLGGQIKIPGIDGRLSLCDANGVVAAQIKHYGTFRYTQSRYYVKTSRPNVGGLAEGQVTATEHYDFGGRDPRAAIAEEAWGNFVAKLAEVRLPRSVRKEGDGYIPADISLRLTPPPQLQEVFKK